MKHCTNPNCSQKNPQPKSAFYKNKTHKDGLYSRCITCSKEYQEKIKEIQKIKKRNYYLKNKANYQKYAKENYNAKKHKDIRLKRIYKITLEEYNLMLNEQNYSCKICLRHENEFERDLAVDHCHKTGKIRGLLCGDCNQALGKLRDNIKLLERAILYLSGSMDGLFKKERKE